MESVEMEEVKKYRVYRRPGRKMQKGRWILSQKTGRCGVYVGDCSNCFAKHILMREDLIDTLKYLGSEERTIRYRLLKTLLRGRSI